MPVEIRAATPADIPAILTLAGKTGMPLKNPCKICDFLPVPPAQLC